MTVTLPPASGNSLASLELFAGAGGLALGIAEAGFQHLAVVEKDGEACRSLRENTQRVASMSGWPVHEVDAKKFDFSPFQGRVALLGAGAPCQPFSQGGKHEGHQDERNLFPIVFDAVARLRPNAVLVENVRGLTRSAFEPYFKYIKARISFPHVAKRRGETWRTHRDRLLELDEKTVMPADRYVVDHVVLNAADFGLPQRRERVFIVAFRADLEVDWARDFSHRMRPHFSEDALLYSKWIDGDYWAQHSLPLFDAAKAPERLRNRLKKLASQPRPQLPRWRTVRDALRSNDPLMGWTPLPEPLDHQDWPGIANHVSNPGARSYPGHTGSEWDAPAKTLKAGHHGVPGGENMLQVAPDKVRYFTVREAARLQGFPDEYEFQGAWTRAFRQVGNSVPVRLAWHVANSIADVLQEKQRRPESTPSAEARTNFK